MTPVLWAYTLTAVIFFSLVLTPRLISPPIGTPAHHRRSHRTALRAAARATDPNEAARLTGSLG